MVELPAPREVTKTGVLPSPGPALDFAVGGGHPQVLGRPGVRRQSMEVLVLVRKTLLVSIVASLMLFVGGSTAHADPCTAIGSVGPTDTTLPACTATVTAQYTALQSDITANVPARLQPTFAALATLAQRLTPPNPIQPSDPLTPATLRPFIPSAAVLRVLWEGNRAFAGSAGFSCASAATIRTDIANFRRFFTVGNLSLLDFTLAPTDPCR
jgi:hypothetical protein